MVGFYQSIFCLISAGILPIFMGYILLKKDLTYFSGEEFEQKYGILTEGVKPNSKINLAYFLMFMIRRLFLFIIAIYVKVNSIQLLLILLLTIFF